MLRVFTLFNLEGTVNNVPKQRRIPYGGLAQLGERLPCKQEVTGSIPVLSTTKRLTEVPKETEGKRNAKAGRGTETKSEISLSLLEIQNVP